VQRATEEPLMFLSGGRAEAKAGQLAEISSKMGAAAEVLIHDRNGTLIGQRAYGVAERC
jgi:hypothetical protein